MGRSYKLTFIVLTVLLTIAGLTCGCENKLGPDQSSLRNAIGITDQDALIEKTAKTETGPSLTWPQFGNTETHIRRTGYMAGGILSTSYQMPLINMSGMPFGEPAHDLSGYAYMTDGEGRLHCVNASTGNPRWTAHRGLYAIEASCTPAIDLVRDRVFYTSYGLTDGVRWVKLWCLSTLTGQELGSWVIGNYLPESSPAIDASGNVYVGAVEYVEDGNLGWRSYLAFLDPSLPANISRSVPYDGGMYATSPAVNSAGTAYIAYTHWTTDVVLMRYNPVVGQLTFPPTGTSGTLPTQGMAQGSPAIGPDGSLFFCMMPALYKLNPATLAITATRLPAVYFSDRCTPAIDALGYVFVGEYVPDALDPNLRDFRMVRFDSALNPPTWYSVPVDDNCITAPSLTSDGYLFVQLNGHLVQLYTWIMPPGGAPMTTIYYDNLTYASSPSIVQRLGVTNVYTITRLYNLVRNTL